MSEREWLVDCKIRCPYCGTHDIKFSEPICGRTGNILNDKFFIMFKFKELEDKIDEAMELFRSDTSI